VEVALQASWYAWSCFGAEMIPRVRFFGLVIVLIRVLGTSCKFMGGSVTVGGNYSSDLWKYVTKFGWAVGRGNYTVSWRLREARPEPLEVQMLLYLDEGWEAAHSAPACAMNADTSPRKTFAVSLPSDGSWAKPNEGHVKQNVRAHIWYFVMSACDAHLREPVILDFVFFAEQEGGSQFSVEQRYMFPLHSVMLVCSTILLAFYVKMCRQTRHPVIWTLSFIIALQYAAQVLHTTHLYLYMKDGMGNTVLETLSDVFFVCSQETQSALLILISWGYCFSTTRSGRVESMLPIAAALWIVHAGVVALSKSRDGAHDKHCEHEGFAGCFLVLLRLIMLARFSSSVEELQRHATRRKRDFLQTFKTAGTAYFVTYPLLFIMVQFFAPYLRQTFMQTSLMAFQLLSDVWLSRLFFARGPFYQMSVWSGSQLPGASSCQDWLPKDS